MGGQGKLDSLRHIFKTCWGRKKADIWDSLEYVRYILCDHIANNAFVQKTLFANSFVVKQSSRYHKQTSDLVLVLKKQLISQTVPWTTAQRSILPSLPTTPVTLRGWFELEWTWKSEWQSELLTRSCRNYINMTLYAHGQCCTRNLFLTRHAVAAWEECGSPYCTEKGKSKSWRWNESHSHRQKLWLMNFDLYKLVNISDLKLLLHSLRVSSLVLFFLFKVNYNTESCLC